MTDLIDLIAVRRGPSLEAPTRALARLGDRRGGLGIAVTLAALLLALLPAAVFGLPGLVLGFLGLTAVCIVAILLVTHG